MNFNRSFLSMAVLIILTAIGSSCEKSNNDPCDDTVMPEIAVTIRTTVHIRDVNNNPIPNEYINFEVYKNPCGADKKGSFKFNGETDEYGNWTCPTTGYNLRNAEDKVVVDVVASELENFFERNYESKQFKYGDFSTLSTKEVHLYIYAKAEN